MKASRETIKMKTSEGEVKVAVLGDSPGAEEYLQHLNTFTRILVRKKLADDLTKCTKAVVSAAAAVRKYLKVPNGEKTSEKGKRLLLLELAKQELVTAEVAESAKVATVYEIFCRGLKEDPELQWDRIMEDMHTKDPWEDLRGVKHEGIRRKSCLSLWVCVDFHKLTVYSIDAAERQRFYMLCNLKKPTNSSIRAHVT
jgi:predicted transcriptional regulator